jgi:hypothetical protein
MKPSEALATAAVIIEEVGWGGDCWYEEKGKLCIQGALYCAYGEDPTINIFAVPWQVRDKWARWFMEAAGFPTITWNDQHAESQEDVVEMLNKAAELAAEAGE